MEARQAELEKQLESQKAVTAKIQALESKLLSGTLEIASQKQAELESKREELAEQKFREIEMLQQLEKQDEATAEIIGTCTSLQQEVQIKVIFYAA